MSFQNHMISLFNLIFPCLNFISESFTRSNKIQECQNSDSSTEVSELPSSLVIEILIKLPIRNLIQYKCVSKTWKDLISDSHFANVYCKNPPFPVLVQSQHNIITKNEAFYFLEIGLQGDLIRTPFHPKALSFERPNGLLRIMGSCNGLLCLEHSPRQVFDGGNYVQNRDCIYNNQTVYIVNPLFGIFMVLPKVIRSEYMSNVVCGFGSSTKSEQYKVVRFVSRYIFDGIGLGYGEHGEIFTTGVDDKWRSFEDPSIPFYLFPCGITLNGVLHLAGDDRRSGFIFAFDLEKEKGSRIEFPPKFGDVAGNVVLALCNGNICLSDNSNENQVDIWTMKEYGVVGSWCREIILKRWIPDDVRLIPVKILRNGDLCLSRQQEGDLLELRSDNLLTFNLKTKECSELEVSAASEGDMCFLFGYVFRASFLSTSSVYEL